MTRYGSLFERLNGEPEAPLKAGAEAGIMASVAGHLAKMLSTRAGSVQTLPDYGLPDLNDMTLSLHDAKTQAREAIERFINVYEPRLSDIAVTSLTSGHDPLSLAFGIEGQLEVEGRKRPVHFSACLDGSGQVTLR